MSKNQKNATSELKVLLEICEQAETLGCLGWQVVPRELVGGDEIDPPPVDSLGGGEEDGKVSQDLSPESSIHIYRHMEEAEYPSSTSTFPPSCLRNSDFQVFSRYLRSHKSSSAAETSLKTRLFSHRLQNKSKVSQNTVWGEGKKIRVSFVSLVA